MIPATEAIVQKFKDPIFGGRTSIPGKGKQKEALSRFSIDAPGAIIMRRPDSAHADKHNKKFVLAFVDLSACFDTDHINDALETCLLSMLWWILGLVVNCEVIRSSKPSFLSFRIVPSLLCRSMIDRGVKFMYEVSDCPSFELRMSELTSSDYR